MARARWRPRRAVLVGAVWVIVATALAGCELRLGTDVTVEPDGSGHLELAVGFDDQLASLLRDAGFDLDTDLEALRVAAPTWTVEREPQPGGGSVLRLGSDFADPDGFAALTEDLYAALDDQDGRLFDDLRVDVSGGRVRFSGRIGLLAPRVPGAEGAGVTFDEQDLTRLLEERGEEFVDYEVRVSLPGEVLAHDADRADGSVLVWDAPVGSMRRISATSDPSDAPPWPLAIAVGALVAVTAGAVAVAVPRRARRRRARR